MAEFERGMVVAAAVVVKAHGQNSVAETILVSAGITSVKGARLIGVDEYDIDILKPVFEHMADQRHLILQKARLA